jgi:hypothetical protein
VWVCAHCRREAAKAGEAVSQKRMRYHARALVYV